jgi:hypothetical protein
VGSTTVSRREFEAKACEPIDLKNGKLTESKFTEDSFAPKKALAPIDVSWITLVVVAGPIEESKTHPENELIPIVSRSDPNFTEVNEVQFSKALVSTFVKELGKVRFKRLVQPLKQFSYKVFKLEVGKLIVTSPVQFSNALALIA